MQRLLIATRNPGKLREIQSLMEGINISLVTLDMVGISMEVAETGSSYEENSALKAAAYVNLANLVTMADDSGLEVDALNGQPGIRSARFSPLPNASDADRRSYLLDLLKAHPRPWTAHFHCTVAIAAPPGR